MSYNKENLQKNLEKLRKNRENISIEELETKYERPYKALLKDIKIQQRDMFLDILKGVCIDTRERESIEQHFKECCELVDKKIYEEYDAEGAENILRNFIGEEFIKKHIVICIEVKEE